MQSNKAVSPIRCSFKRHYKLWSLNNKHNISSSSIVGIITFRRLKLKGKYGIAKEIIWKLKHKTGNNGSKTKAIREIAYFIKSETSLSKRKFDTKHFEMMHIKRWTIAVQGHLGANPCFLMCHLILHLLFMYFVNTSCGVRVRSWKPWADLSYGLQ